MATQGPLSNHKLGNKYELGELLGYGGFGEVYKAHNIPLNRPQAIKVILEKHLSNPKYRERFRREAQTLAAMNHPHIVHIDDFELEQERAFLVMPFISGGTLYSILVKAGQLPLTVAEHYLEQICPALDYAHAQNVVHLDLKPQNLLHQNENDVLLLSDFGLAHLMEQGAVEGGTSLGLGSPLYMAPEQINGSPQPRSDIYALGVILYQMLAGRPPFEGSAPGAVAIKHVQEPPPSLSSMRPDVPQTVVSVVEKALAKNPENRYATAGALLQDFHTAISSASTLPVRLEESQKREPTDNRTIQRVEPPPLVNLSLQADHKESTTEIRNRRRMLDKVRSFWINGLLEESLHGAALVALGLSEQRRAVANPWRLILQHQHQPPSTLAPGTHITQVFDRANGELLILGEPGSGKTTLLLELTRDLLDRAQIDDTEPIPVVFNLSSWAVKRQPLNQWIIEELNAKYQIPRKIGQLWVETDQLLLLLDGLDEVAPEYFEACIDAINIYRGEHGLEPLVVCSRSTEYLKRPGQARLLQLQSAVIVQPLTIEQIEEYLTNVGEKLTGVRQAFDEDEKLQELVTTPLMLSIITLAYAGVPAEQLSVTGSLAARREQVFARYVQRQLSTRPAGLYYSEQQSVYWLSWLAQQLVKQEQTEFYLEGMQLDGWLVKSRPAEIYTSLALALLTFLVAFIVLGLEYTFGGIGFALINGTLVGLLCALVAFFFVWIIEADFHLLPGAKKRQEQPEVAETSKKRSKLAAFFTPVFWERAGFAVLCGAVVAALVQFLVGPLYALINGLFVAAFLVILGRFDRIIQPAERLIWSWKSFFENAVPSLLIGLGFGTLGGIFDAYPYFQQRPVFLATMYFWWSLGGAFGIVIMLVRGLTNKEIDKRQKAIKPNQGIRNSLSNSLKVGISSGTLIGIVIFFFYSYVMHKVFIVGYINEIPANSDVIYGVGDMVTILYLFWLINGGFATVQHLMLRIRLWQIGCIPWRYPRFLDYATERIFLNRVGGGYMFVHKLLLEYFADLGMEEGLSPTPAESQQP